MDLKRSKSTPGLVESSGKVPMETTSITRHHTLPAGLPTHRSSIDHTDLQSSRDPHHNGDETHAQQTNDQSTGVRNADHCTEQNMETTQIRTVSSVTSFLTGSPLVRSPLHPEGQAPMFRFSPPLTPGPQVQFSSPFQSQTNPNMAVPGTAPFAEYTPRDGTHDYGLRAPAQYQQQAYYPFTQFNQAIPGTGMNSVHPQQPITFLSPFCASTGYVSPMSPNFASTRNEAPTSTAPQQAPRSVVNGMSSQPVHAVNSTHIYNEASHDSLVQEITRLRERLKSVESENAVMSAKLNQQQWELEHRLSELEMHMTCTSDLASSGSTDDPSNPFENISRESII